MIGSYSNIDNGKIDYGYMLSSQNTVCPSEPHEWRESYNNEWEVNLNSHVSCDGKW